MDSYSDDDDDSAQPISLDEISELQLARDLVCVGMGRTKTKKDEILKM